MNAYALGGRWPGTAQAYQDFILPQVSRTFALTIPQLPADVARAVANAYLLCRAADTIEDEPALRTDDKRTQEQALIEIVAGHRAPEPFASQLAPRLSAQTLESERDLVRQLSLVLTVTATLSPAQRAAVARCITVMGRGMHRFQTVAGPRGLDTLRDLDRYCYYVAGVVGEMLTELFCEHDPRIAARSGRLRARAVSFGQGLQMTNILKDQWEDRARGVCWLPREVFRRHGVDEAALAAGRFDAGYAAAQEELLGLAHAHLRQALDYALSVPARETGIRRFCLWSVALALQTLRNMQRRPDFTAGAQVKVPRRTVATSLMLVDLMIRSDTLLRRLFAWFARGLPLTPLSADWGTHVTPAAAAVHAPAA